MLWCGMMYLTGVESPVVVVLSGSMEPGFYRGDLLVLTKPAKISNGDIVVFRIKNRDIPIVHRAMKYHEDSNKNIKVLTKGDNNMYDDRMLYEKGKVYLNNEEILGVVKAYIPYFGIFTLLINDYPM